MFAKIKKFLLDLFTENDGKSVCPVRTMSILLTVPTIIMFIVGFALKIHSGNFDGHDLATSFSILSAGIAASAAGIAAKALTDTTNSQGQ